MCTYRVFFLFRRGEDLNDLGMYSIHTGSKPVCRLFVTDLANDPRVSVEAAMCTSCHTLLLLTVPAKLWGKDLTKHGA